MALNAVTGGLASIAAAARCGTLIATAAKLATVAIATFELVDSAKQFVDGAQQLAAGNPWGAVNVAFAVLGYRGALDGLATAARGACFSAGTPLLTPDGWKRIEELQRGDLVLSRDEHNLGAPLEAKPVEETFVRMGRLMRLVVRGVAIETTPEHPFWVLGKGWTPAGDLVAGDFLNTHTGEWVKIDEADPTEVWSQVYNLSVADHHTYFVGREEWGWSVWAHNTYFVVRQSTAGGFEVLREGEFVKSFSTGSPALDKAAANSYRRQLQKLDREAAIAARASVAAENGSQPRIQISGRQYIAVFTGKAEQFLKSHSTLRSKFSQAASNGVVPPRGRTGIVVSELPGYDYKIKILGAGGDYRIHGKIAGSQIIFDRITTH